MKGAQKGILTDIVGLPRPHDAGRHAEDDVAVALHQRLKGAQIAAAGALDENAVGVHDRWGQTVIVLSVPGRLSHPDQHDTRYGGRHRGQRIHAS